MDIKALVCRTSVWSDVKPCEEAKLEEFTIGTNIHNEWVVEIKSLESFIEKYGTIIIDKCDFDGVSLEIEIYDDYRE